MKNNKLSYTIARIISTIFVPPTFTVLLFIYTSFLLENDGYKRAFIISVSVIFGLLIPVFVFIKLRKTNKITDPDTSIKEQRDIPYLLNSLFCLSAIPPIFILNTALFFLIVWIIFFFATLILYFINKHWKISAHLIGATIFTGALFYLQNETVFFLIPLLLIISWARIKLRIHNLTQVLAGGVLGFSLTYFTLYFIYNFVIT